MTDSESPETTAQMLARLIHSGGKILVAGGTVGDLPSRYTGHPALVIWDDNDQDFSHKEVPANVRAILTTRWISHPNRDRLRVAADRMRALRFPNLRARQIKELLSEIIQEAPEPVETVDAAALDQLVEQLRPVAATLTREEEGDSELAKKSPGVGELTAYIAKHLKVDTDWTVRGSIRREGERLLERIKAEGKIKTTPGSVNQAVGKMVRDLGKATATRRKTAAVAIKTRETEGIPAGTKKGDDFDELMSLLGDAVSALKLVQEHMPKVRKEVEKLRTVRDRMMKALGQI